MSDEFPKGPVPLSLDQIPVVREPMSIIKLGDPVLAPDNLIHDIVQVVAPEAEFKDIEESGSRGAYHKNRLVAFIDHNTGHSKVFPTLEMLKPGAGLAEQAKAIVAKLAHESALFPEDGTEAVTLEPLSLFGAKHNRGENGSKPSEYISYVCFQRRVNGLPVYGPGPKATIGVAADGSVCALTHKWRKAISGDEKIMVRPREDIYKIIIEQIKQMAGDANVKVDKVEICYYDGGGKYIQPVYRYEATIKLYTSDQPVRLANSHLLGYVTIGVEREPVMQQTMPTQKPSIPAKSNAERKSPPKDDPTVGRYIIRNAGDAFWQLTWPFIDNLQSAGNQLGVQFTDSQYFWEDDFIYTTDKEYYINSVQIALTKAHGNWGMFWLNLNPNTDMTLLKIGNAGGYGQGPNALAYWIIHACEVIPTQDDESNSFDVWWNIFKGLHAVVGFRTEAFIDDGVPGPFGGDIGHGAAIVSAWIHEVLSSSAYQGDSMYCDSNRHIMEPFGRPSAVVVDGHQDDTVTMTDPIISYNTLWEFWIGNNVNCPPCKP